MVELTGMLKEMWDEMQALAEAMFMELGYVQPTYMFDSTDNEGLTLMPAPPIKDKYLSTELVKIVFERKGATMVVFFDEAWKVSGEKVASDADLSRNPKRKEILFFIAESRDRHISGEREIIRKGKKSRLGKLEIIEFDHAEGNLVGLLPRPEGVRLS